MPTYNVHLVQTAESEESRPEVEYVGSITAAHGTYTVIDHCACERCDREDEWHMFHHISATQADCRFVLIGHGRRINHVRGSSLRFAVESGRTT